MANAIDLVVDVLLADAVVTSRVGQRVYPVVAPQNSLLPSIVVSQVSEGDVLHLAGHAAGYPESRVSVVSRGATYTEMADLSDAVRACLQNVGNRLVLGRETSIFKAASDVTQFFDEPPVYEQTSDYRVRWRSA